MILSASRRTDIPCWYAEWFMNRIREGFVLTRNPMNHAQLFRVPLTPDIVDGIVFWTKDAAGILPHLDELDALGYSSYFQFTLTPYDHTLEPGLREKADIEDTFLALSKKLGSERVVWRYDPIILNDAIDIAAIDIAYHKVQFERMCVKLSGFTDTVTISFVDLYPKLKTQLIREISSDEIAELAEFFGETARKFHINPVACCENTDLTRYGIQHASCIDRARIEKLCGFPLEIGPDKNQREGCGCCESIDIGAYNTCPNDCVYCYANNSPETTLRRYRSHDPNSALLAGTVAEGERITGREVKSNKRQQMTLF